MIRRPLDRSFRELVPTGIKSTTIREKPWPVGVPIMLYSWKGKPYRSKQEPLGVVVVTQADPIVVHHRRMSYGAAPGEIVFEYEFGLIGVRRLYRTEGFSSHAALCAWFEKVVPLGSKQKKHLMQFIWQGPAADGPDRTMGRLGAADHGRAADSGE